MNINTVFHVIIAHPLFLDEFSIFQLHIIIAPPPFSEKFIIFQLHIIIAPPLKISIIRRRKAKKKSIKTLKNIKIIQVFSKMKEKHFS